jgi:two-component system OmpR family response regulator
MNSSHILVVDDLQEMREVVRQILETNGYRVSTAANGAEMQRVIGGNPVDLIVLDLMLPGKDGLTLCRELRAAQLAVPIIILTAKGDEIDRVLGLEMGADDYVAKPFSSRELVARIKAVLRRTQATPETSRRAVFRFGRWCLDTARRELEVDRDVLVPLSTGEYDLLLSFVQHPQRVLSRDQLLSWSKGRDTDSSDRSIDLQVSRLRRKLRDDAKNPAVIRTVRGGGYIFTLPVSGQ